MVDLEGKLQLEYYKFQKTFEGAITLENEKGAYEAAKKKGAASSAPKEPLDEIIEKINEKYKGAFTKRDRVLLTALHRKMSRPQYTGIVSVVLVDYSCRKGYSLPLQTAVDGNAAPATTDHKHLRFLSF